MSMKIDMSSVTPQQVYNLTLAFQKTRDMGLPQQITTEPTVTVAGRGMGWISPSLTVERAQAVLNEYNRMEAGLFDAGSVSIGEVRATVAGLPPMPEAMRSGKTGVAVPGHLRPGVQAMVSERYYGAGTAYVEGEDALDPASGEVSNPAADDADKIDERIKPGVTVLLGEVEFEVLRVGGEGLADDVAIIQRGDEESQTVLISDLEYLHEPDTERSQEQRDREVQAVIDAGFDIGVKVWHKGDEYVVQAIWGADQTVGISKVGDESGAQRRVSISVLERVEPTEKG